MTDTTTDALAGGCPHLAAQAREFDIFQLTPGDPYPLLREMQTAGCPIAHSDRLGGYWILTKYEDVMRVLRDPKIFSSDENFLPSTHDPVFGKAIPLQIDRPEHTFYRKIMAPFFSPAAIETMRDKTRAAAIELLEPIAEQERVEFVETFCGPFPGLVFLPLLGLSRDELRDLLRLHAELLEFNRDPNVPGIADKRIVASEAVRDRIEQVLAAREGREQQPDDIVKGLLDATTPDGAKDGRRLLERQELVRIYRLFFSAGLDTVKNTLSMAMWFLATHPEHRRQLVDDPSLIPGAVEEFLRHFAPTSFYRILTEDQQFGDVTIRKGEMVLLPTLVANHDPDRFPDPDNIDFTRSPNPHVGLGAGPHRCAGSHLARMELQVALEEIHRIIPEYELAPGADPQWHGGTIIGVDDLELVIGGSRA
jgi:cytochrome P450